VHAADVKGAISRALRWVLQAEAREEDVVGEAPPSETDVSNVDAAPGAPLTPTAGASAPADGSAIASAPADDPAETQARNLVARIPHARLRFCVAIGIVVAAISTAAGAWRAEIFTEYATQKDALARQALTGLQLSERSDEELTMSELRQLGAYQRDVSLASQLQRLSGHGVPATGPEAQNEAMLAAAKYDSFTLSLPTGPGDRATLVPTQIYRTALADDVALATFDPSDLDAKASQARSDAVDMAVVAVFFALVVVLLTLSEIILRRHQRSRLGRWHVGHALAATSLLVWVGAFVWFAVLYLDVPKLK
jgi:hypothetical protein